MGGFAKDDDSDTSNEDGDGDGVVDVVSIHCFRIFAHPVVYL